MQHRFQLGKALIDRVVVQINGRQVRHTPLSLRGGWLYDRDLALHALWLLISTITVSLAFVRATKRLDLGTNGGATADGGS